MQRGQVRQLHILNIFKLINQIYKHHENALKLLFKSRLIIALVIDVRYLINVSEKSVLAKSDSDNSARYGYCININAYSTARLQNDQRFNEMKPIAKLDIDYDAGYKVVFIS